jgi:glyoxylase-like metal-dependent hydrolase (beta-lactamase superfamily II)
VHRIILLTLGWEDLPKSWSVHGSDPELRLVEPVPGVLLQCDGGWMLLDTGCNPALIRDRALYERFHGRGTIQVILPGPGDPLEEALDRVGVDIGAIAAVGVSHLHNDHAGGLRHFAARVPVHLQRAELDYGLHHHPEAERNGIFRIDFDDPVIDWRLAEGDTEIAPGVVAVATGGHTPGHQSFMVSIDESAGGGGFVFAFDAADLTENLEHERAIGGFIGCEPAATVEPIRRLKALAAERGYRLLPGHDPDVWPAVTAELAARWPVLPPLPSQA